MGDEYTTVESFMDESRAQRRAGSGLFSNVCTQYVDVLGRDRPGWAREAFEAAWPLLKQRAEFHRRDGLSVALLGPSGRPSETAVLRAEDGPEHLVVGRHERADLALDLYRMSLRHLMILKEPGVEGYEILDLASLDGTTDEAEGIVHRRRVQGYSAFRLCGCTVHCAPLSWVRDLPSDPASAWEALGGDEGTRARVKRQTEVPADTMRPSRFAPFDGSLGPIEATLTVWPGGRDAAYGVPLRQKALEAGVILGRYSRCAIPVRHDRVSRVHVLLLRLRDGTYLFDLASTNGIGTDREIRSQGPRDPDEGPRRLRLEGPTVVRLFAARIRYQPYERALQDGARWLARWEAGAAARRRRRQEEAARRAAKVLPFPRAPGPQAEAAVDPPPDSR